MKFDRSPVSKLRSARRSLDRRIAKAEWRMSTDASANLAFLSHQCDEWQVKADTLTKAIDHELAVDERRALRQLLLTNNG
jgi:hypothetical protein